MKDKFTRKIFTAGIFINDIGYLIKNSPQIICALQNKKINRALKEKVMSVVTAVNGCTYCAWFHAKQAVASGISEEEVKNMFNLQFHADASDFEMMALLYAQHFAETNRQPDYEMTKRLIDYYGDKTSKHLILFIRMIYFGNLIGNTWDAVLSRLKGNPAKESNIVFEFIFFLLTFWFMLPAILLTKEKKA
jgi:AhpD family alkylhydroperoxidase